VSERVGLTFRDGGWIVIVAALLVIAVVLWAFAGVLSGHRRVGGFDVASYGFDLSTCLIPREAITPSGQPRDFLRPLVVERTMAGSAMVEFNRKNRKRYVVSDDRVVGVVIGGAARAYPLYLLNGHEVIEDTLGGVPIAVTYSPLCDAINVFDRRIGGDGPGATDVRLHVSGLLHNANSLLYDQAETPSLWRQLDGKAIAGPHAASGSMLTQIPGVALTTWTDWLTTHPETDLPERIQSNIRLYQNISYTREHASPTLEFPVTPVPGGQLPWKSTVLLLRVGNTDAIYSFDRMKAAATDGVFTCDVGDTGQLVTLQIHLPTAPEPAWRIEHDGSRPVFSRSTFWFAASSILPSGEPLPEQR
jgi:Protein of unknown function (DUF3179)